MADQVAERFDSRKLVVEYAVRQFHEEPERESISMEPSAGGRWCECEPCAAMGSVSDRVVMLANEVAETINDLGYGAKYVGILAYHMHSPPPTIDVHPNVVVRAATNAVRGGYTHQQIIEGWQQRGATTGVSDFYSVFVWDSSMPARQKASDIPYIRESVTRFHRTGIRYFNASPRRCSVRRSSFARRAPETLETRISPCGGVVATGPRVPVRQRPPGAGHIDVDEDAAARHTCSERGIKGMCGPHHPRVTGDA